MKKKIMILALLFIIIIIFGGYYLILNSSNNHTFSLDTVALTVDDIDGNYILKDEIHWTEPGNFTNSTGDGSKWNYTEHYQSSFLQNNTTNASSANEPANMIIQSITRLESKEKAALYVDLWTNGRQKKEGYLKIPIKTIGDKSGYFTYTITHEDYKIYNYILVFSIDDISVTVGGGGPTVTQSMYLDLAKIIESKILNSK